MNANGGQRQTLRETYGRKSAAWEDKIDPIIRFTTDEGDTIGLPFFSLMCCRHMPAQEAALFEFQAGNIVIQGPGSKALFENFCAQRATAIRPDGKDLTSVTLILPQPATDPTASAPVDP